jgi:hypothetical protein
MDLLASIGLGMIGFLIGNIAFSRAGHWIVSLHQISKDEGGAKVGKFASVTLLSAGPWFLIALAVSAYFIYPQPWSLPSLSARWSQSCSLAPLPYISVAERAKLRTDSVAAH